MLALLLAAALQTASAPPELVTGSDLVRVCRGSDTYQGTYCIAYVSGVHDTVRSLEGAELLVNLGYCLPERITVGAVSTAVSNHISGDEELWSMDAATATVLALMNLYPCSRT